MLKARLRIRGRICKRRCSRAAWFLWMVCEPGLFRARMRAGAHTPQIMWMAARASPGATVVSETGHVPRVCIVISGPGSVGFSGVTVRPGSVCLCRSDIARVLGCVGLCRMESPDCVCWWRFCWSRVGQGVLA